MTPLDHLTAELGDVAAARRDDRFLNGDLNDRRLPSIAALVSVLKYLRAIGAPEEARNALADVLAGLDDANEGRRNDLFTPMRDLSKPRLHSKRSAAMWTASAAAVMLAEAGVDEDKAFRDAAKAAGTNAEKLKTFAKALQAHRRSDEAVKFYKKTLALRDQPHMTPKEVAEQLLKNIAVSR